MNNQTLNQIKQDITRLENAADRLRDLRDAYLNTLDDLRIAQQGLKYVATWATSIRTTDPFNTATIAINIHDRAMDTLARISEANR